MHGVVENVDLEKHRQSQDHFGVLLSNSKDVEIREFEIEKTNVCCAAACFSFAYIIFYHKWGGLCYTVYKVMKLKYRKVRKIWRFRTGKTRI